MERDLALEILKMEERSSPARSAATAAEAARLARRKKG
jgi:hypothetical protein